MIINSKLPFYTDHSSNSTTLKFNDIGYVPMFSILNTYIYGALNNLNDVIKSVYAPYDYKKKGNILTPEKKLQVKTKVDSYLKNSNYPFKVYGQRGTGNMKSVYEYMYAKNHTMLHNLSTRPVIYSTAFMSLAKVNYNYANTYKINNINLLMCLVVKKEYVEYVKLCLLTNKEINPKVFEFWINTDLEDFKKEYISENKFLKGDNNVTRFIKDFNIKVVHTNKLKYLFYNVITPTFSRLSERKEWLIYCSQKFIAKTILNQEFEVIDKFELKAPVIPERPIKPEKKKRKPRAKIVVVEDVVLVEETEKMP